ncbi:efflux transporter outer membrane subunit [Hydrocarboniphaga effusa]|uniref:efflux transporter outer membrane subunit n=1 Tax=Hydrocarboniphaga effusa TaxID=243629 RepID=UPI003BABF0D1
MSDSMHRPSRLHAFAAAIGAMLLAGCTLAPRYEQPAAPIAAQYDAVSVADATGAVPASAVGWREFFTDPTLQGLIDTALRNNLDLREAALNVEAARAQYRIQRAELLPTLNATGSGSVQKTPTSALGFGSAAGGGGGGGADSIIIRAYSAGIGVTSYELDLFGRIRSLNKARLADYLSLEEARRSTQISLIAQVASSYFALLADERLLAVTRSTFESQQSTLTLTQQRVNVGVADALTLRQVETSVYTAQANLARYERQVKQDRNALAQLLGVPSLPENLSAGSGLDEQRLAVQLAPGLPSELLVRRPDILAAEHSLIAANANIGAARAAFFPSITLTGSYGSTSPDLDGLFDSGTESWSFSPSIRIPIFAAGANRANLDLAHVQKDINVARYEAAIQTAFREVADALAARSTYDEELKAQQGLADAANESFKLANLRYERGVDSYLTVLDSQRSQYTAQQSLETLKLARLQNLATLYKVLGGGWSQSTQARTAEAQN